MTTNINFTPKEVEILKLVAKEKSKKQVAGILKISLKTLDSHLKNIYLKTNRHSYAELTAFCFVHGYHLPDNE